jgi:sugar O-acyltransferase (sialic acid O-acetyltransferase NeuD family)
MIKAIVVGDGGHAASIIEILHSLQFEVIGLISKSQQSKKCLFGVESIGTDADLEDLRSSVDHAFIGIGQIKSVALRKKIYFKLKKYKYKQPKLIAPTAYVSKYAEIASGTSIHPNSFLNSNVSIGENCIVNSGAILEHDVQIGSHTHVSTGCIINGNVEIGENCFIGSGAIVFQGVRIPDNTIIPAGKVIK